MTSEALGEKEKIQESSATLKARVNHGKRKRKPKAYESVTIKIPSRRAPEVPILVTLAKSPDGKRTAEVLRQVKKHWFKELSDLDLRANYPKSKKRIVDSVIKFGRKHLIGKGELYPPSEENPIGRWRATPAGVKRAQSEEGGWSPSYVESEGLIEVEGGASETIGENTN
ncbi:MAG: hypothetical protein ACHQ1H_09035 [Nitrososphaerales archaeon]